MPSCLESVWTTTSSTPVWDARSSARVVDSSSMESLWRYRCFSFFMSFQLTLIMHKHIFDNIWATCTYHFPSPSEQIGQRWMATLWFVVYLQVHQGNRSRLCGARTSAARDFSDDTSTTTCVTSATSEHSPVNTAARSLSTRRYRSEQLTLVPSIHLRRHIKAIRTRNQNFPPPHLRLIHTELKLQPTSFRLAAGWLLILKLVWMELCYTNVNQLHFSSLKRVGSWSEASRLQI